MLFFDLCQFDDTSIVPPYFMIIYDFMPSGIPVLQLTTDVIKLNFVI